MTTPGTAHQTVAMDIIRQYLPLCWFSLNPLDLPRSFSFLKYNIFFYFTLEFFLQANMTDDPVESFYEVLFETVLTLVLVATVLALNKILYVYVQVLTALLFVLNAVATSLIPVLVWMTTTEDPLSLYVLGLQLFWGFFLVAYILGRTLAINWPASLVMALFYFLVTYLGAYGLGLVLL